MKNRPDLSKIQIKSPNENNLDTKRAHKTDEAMTKNCTTPLKVKVLKTKLSTNKKNKRNIPKGKLRPTNAK
jgi:hypothetical protein